MKKESFALPERDGDDIDPERPWDHLVKGVAAGMKALEKAKDQKETDEGDEKKTDEIKDS